MKTLVTGAFPLDDERRKALEDLGLELYFHQDERSPVAQPEQYEAVICNGLFLYHDLKRFSNLRYIQLTSAGMDRVPVQEIHARGVVLRNAAGVYSIPMAEWTVLRLLELYKNAAHLWRCQESGLWEKDRGWLELSGKTACIVGFGAYGMETAKRLKALGMRVHVVNRSKKSSPWADRWYGLDELEAALGTADAVILAIALTEQTKDLMGPAQFAAMKPGAVLLNAARGNLVDESALLDALEAGKLSGAALDVFRTEPLPPESPLWNHPRLLLSPHNSFVGEGNFTRLFELICSNLRRFI